MTSIEKQMLIEQRVQNEGKSTVVAYLLLIFFGSLGIYRFYLGRVKSGLLMLACYIIGLILVFSGFFGAAATAVNYAQTTNATTAAQQQEAILAGASTGFSGVAIIGVLLLAFAGIWCFVDLFRIPSYIRKQRDALRKSLADQFQ